MKQFLIYTCLLWISSACLAQDVGFKVIVNSENNITEVVDVMMRDTLNDVFRKKWSKWPKGAFQGKREKIVVLNLSVRSPVRSEFSMSVHGESAEQIQSMWDRSLFSGSRPGPGIVKTEDAMIREVSNNPGAIGYVSVSAVLPETVKVIPVIGQEHLAEVCLADCDNLLASCRQRYKGSCSRRESSEVYLAACLDTGQSLCAEGARHCRSYCED